MIPRLRRRGPLITALVGPMAEVEIALRLYW
jgi:hypothetical protein